MNMKRAETPNETHPPFVRRLGRPVSSVLVVALLAAAAPTPAKAAFKDMSGSLPGFASKGALIGAGVGAGVLVGLLVYYKLHHKDSLKLVLRHDAGRFADLPSGQAAERTVPISNEMSVPVTITSIAVDDTAGCFKFPTPPAFPLPLAAGEPLNLPVTISTGGRSCSARIRIVATSPKFKKDGVAILKLSYGPHKTGIKRVIP
jgi:hypothetical protein